MLRVDSTRAVQYQWLIWRIFGINRPKDNSFWSRYYLAYGIAFNAIANVWVPMSFYINCLMSTTLSDFCESFYLLPPVALQQMKFFNVWRVRSRLRNLNSILKRLDTRLQSQDECNLIEDAIAQSNQTFNNVLRLFIGVICSSLVLVTLSSEQKLPYPAWFPWNWQGSTRAYWSTVIFQNLTLNTLMLMTLNNDTYSVAYLNMVSGHYRALALRISQLGDMHEKQAYKRLIECIKDHQIILKLVDTMENTLSVACFFQFSCTAISLCALGFFIAYVQLSFSKLFNLFFMFLAIIIETFLLCNAAEVVSNEAENVSNAIYASNWTKQPIRFRRTMLTMLHRSQRPIVLMAIGLIPVRMTTCVTVLKSAYSMLTLLIDMNSDADA